MNSFVIPFTNTLECMTFSKTHKLHIHFGLSGTQILQIHGNLRNQYWNIVTRKLLLKMRFLGLFTCFDSYLNLMNPKHTFQITERP